MSKARKEVSEFRINVILVLFTLWMGGWLISLWAYFLRVAPQPGLTNLEMAAGWQGVVAMIAVAIFGTGYTLPKENGIRRVSAVPMGMALFMVVLAIIGIF
jgi:hypothetical protein